MELSVWMSWADTPASVPKDTSERSTNLTHTHTQALVPPLYQLHPHLEIIPRSPSLCSGQLCEVPPSLLSLCELADCQNNAPCVERGGRALCQCPPEFGGPRCEKLVSVNFVDRDSYLLLSDLKNWPQANITLQVLTDCVNVWHVYGFCLLTWLIWYCCFWSGNNEMNVANSKNIRAHIKHLWVPTQGDCALYPVLDTSFYCSLVFPLVFLSQFG